MRRIAAVTLLAAALGAGAVAHAQAPALSARLAACETGAAPADRFAVFTGAMPREGAAVMAMRFDLDEKLPGEAWRPVALEGWGEWIRAGKKGVPGFIYTKRLEQLAAPAAFRVVVGFRWSEADGTVIKTARRTSRTCRQPDRRPDLHVRKVALDDDGTARVVVENRGRGTAGTFAVHAARGDFVKARTLAGLPAGEHASVSLRVGPCAAGETVTVTLDPGQAVAEAREDDNDVTVACPA